MQFDNNNAAPICTNPVPVQGNSGSIKMLLMSFITFICLMILPLFSFSGFMNLQLHATDVVKFSLEGIQLSELSEGDLTDRVNDAVYEVVYSETDPVVQQQVNQIGAVLIEVTAQLEPVIINTVASFKTIAIALFAASVFIIAAFIVLIFAAVKNKIKLYILANAAIFAILAVICAAVAIKVGASVLGIGIFATMLMSALSIITVLKKKKVK